MHCKKLFFTSRRRKLKSCTWDLLCAGNWNHVLFAGKLKSYTWDLLCAGNWNHALEIYCAVWNWNHALEIRFHCAWEIENPLWNLLCSWELKIHTGIFCSGKLKIHCGKYCAMGNLRFTNYKYAAWGTGNWKSIVLSTVLLLFTVHGKLSIP